MPEIGVISLGCSKNRVDTEYMLYLLKTAGHEIVNDAKTAEIIIVNTCGFIESAKQESIDTILEYAQFKKTAKCTTLVVTGCLSERYRDELFEELPEVDILIGVHEYHNLPALIEERLSGGNIGLTTNNTNECKHNIQRVLTTPKFSAYLRVADGCNNRCAYCAIPLIRGGLKSLPLEILCNEAELLVSSGVSELTVIAQDTSGYGSDIYGNPKLMELLRRISGIDGLKWLRLLYTYPDTVTKELVEFLASNERTAAYLDMPIQHCNDELLTKMNRRGTKSHMEKLLKMIRRDYPDFILRTTVMVGFPGETEAQFDELMAFISEYEFDRLGAFAFSPEENTKAASMPNQLDEETKRIRLDEIMRLQNKISKKRNEGRVGREYEVLIEGIDGGYAVCRSYAEAPEVDGKILLPVKAVYRPGQYIKARLSGAGDYDFVGEEV